MLKTMKWETIQQYIHDESKFQVLNKRQNEWQRYRYHYCDKIILCPFLCVRVCAHVFEFTSPEKKTQLYTYCNCTQAAVAATTTTTAAAFPIAAIGIKWQRKCQQQKIVLFCCVNELCVCLCIYEM